LIDKGRGEKSLEKGAGERAGISPEFGTAGSARSAHGIKSATKKEREFVRIARSKKIAKSWI